jgi:anthranilate synthase/aminodeoxychorismate synthase-like glutamine amidotransferase
MSTPRVLMVDNYDSFTFNLVQYMLALGASVTVRRNDDVTPTFATTSDFTHVVISPGPGCPDEAGASKSIIAAAAGKVPLLGVCLGHQAMAEVFGAKVGRARCLMHGKSSVISHDAQGVYRGLEAELEVGRYHSLVAFAETIPPELLVTSRTIMGTDADEPQEIMGLRHTKFAMEGVQFHPESVLTPRGARMLANFLNIDPARADAIQVMT